MQLPGSLPGQISFSSFFIFQQTEQLSFIFLHLPLSDLPIIYYTVFFLIF